MQRVFNGKSSGPLGTDPPSALGACFLRASGVNAGILPSGGSTMSDVRLLATTGVPWSRQTSLYSR